MTLAQGLRRRAAKRRVSRLRRRPHGVPAAVDTMARRRDRRSRADRRDPRQFRDADRRVARVADESRMSDTVRLTMAQALVRYLAALRVEARTAMPLFGGVFAIFGHGNVAGVGEALFAHRDVLPTYRAHNEQAMAHAAIAYAKANMRRRMMACTTSIGPGRDEPGDRGGARARQPAAGVAAAGRHLRLARARSGAAAGRGLPATAPSRRTIACGRYRAISTASRIRRNCCTALPRAIRVLTDPGDCAAR